jgi:6-phosphogluconolactonase
VRTAHASVLVLPTPQAVARAGAERVAEIAVSAVNVRGACSIALSGGETPRPLYRLLGSSPLSERTPWDHLDLFFGDERAVPPDSDQSNYGMVRQELLSHIVIPSSHVHRIAAEKEPAAAAREYEDELRKVVGKRGGRLDLILLGLGDDGHTASIFPGTLALEPGEDLIRAVFVQRLKSWRITMTLRSINAARKVIFLVAGKAKAPIVRRILLAGHPSPLLPASMIQPENGEVVWIIDQEAASALV